MNSDIFTWLWNAGRLLMLGLIPVGYVVSSEYLDMHEPDYFLFNLGAFLSMCYLLFALPRVRSGNLVIVILLLIFSIGYFFKFYSLAYLLGSNASQTSVALMFGMSAKWIDMDMAYRAFQTVAVAFMVFALVSLLMLFLFPAKVLHPPVSVSGNADRAIQPLIVLAIMLAVVAGFPRFALHLDHASLPFHLEGIINILSHTVVPGLIGLSLVLAMQARNWALVRGVSLLFVIWGVLQFLAFASKMDLIQPIFWYALGCLITGFRNNKLEMIFLYGVVCMILLFPFIGYFRMAQEAFLFGDTADVLQEIQYLYVLLAPDIGGFTDAIGYALATVLYRIVGFSELMSMQMLYDAHPHGFLSYLFSSQTAGDLLTRSMGTAGERTGFASSLLGQAYFATGSNWGAALLVGVWTVVSFLVSWFLIQSRQVLFPALWILVMVSFSHWSVDEFGFYKLPFLLVAWMCMMLSYHTIRTMFPANR